MRFSRKLTGKIFGLFSEENWGSVFALLLQSEFASAWDNELTLGGQVISNVMKI